MDPDLIEYEGGEVLASLEDRTVTGLLVPFNELGQTNAGRFIVEAGALALPSDPSVISLNLDHDRSLNVGRASRVWEEPAVGIMATFKIATTPEGDAYLADAVSPTGTRKCLSGEFHTAIQAGKAVPGSGRLWGGAGVRAGAFPSAMVLAEDRSSASKYITEYEDENGVKWRRVEETTTTTTETETGQETTSVTTVTEETTGNEKEGTVPEETTTVEAGAVPVTLATPGGAPATTIQRLPALATIFAAIATSKNRMATKADKVAAEAVLAGLPDVHVVLAALQDVVPGGATPLTAPGVVQPNWVGLIAQGVPYVREYINLHKPGTEISLGGKKGFKVKRGTSAAPVTGNFDGTYAGNKSEVKSYKGFTTAHESVLDQFAIAEDFARIFFDLPGGAEAVAAFISLIVEDHLVWSDETALEYIVETAGAPIAPTTAAYPAAYPDALGMLIQGILTVKRKKADGRRDVPTYAIANDEAFEQIVYAAGGEQNLPAFVSIAMNTLGNGAVDGSVQVVNGDVGIVETPAVIVGADYAIDFDEPAGGPLLIDAIDIAKAGIDKAVHGYLQTFVKRPEAIVLIGTVDV